MQAKAIVDTLLQDAAVFVFPFDQKDVFKSVFVSTQSCCDAGRTGTDDD